MLDNAKYLNHRNEVVEFGKNGIFLNYNDLRDYSWNYSTDFNRISNFKRGITSKSIPLTLFHPDKEQAIILKNKIYEVSEKDILANKPGTLFVGDYYLKCYIVSSKKSEYLIGKEYIKIDISLVMDEPVWIKETTQSFYPASDLIEEGIKDYPYDYPYGYATGLYINSIYNTSFMDSNFKIVIYGPCINPTIYIAGKMYQVNTTLSSGEYLTINTLDKTIVTTKQNGETINEFAKRNKAYSVFSKIATGQNIISWSGDFGFDIILIEERSEPKWI